MIIINISPSFRLHIALINVKQMNMLHNQVTEIISSDNRI